MATRAPGHGTAMALSALVLACTLKPSPAESSSVLLGQQVLAALDSHGVAGELVRVVDHHVKFGVTTDEGDGDEWPQIRTRRAAWSPPGRWRSWASSATRTGPIT